ncbi:hypothetical protein [Shewanella sp. TC10]|uniref:hypothetical protein n=1 Tax=Shewanella sp. TC10 TaxID=1419739 RepID=UPI00129EC6DE|nr:hypothetical protein [Shewanella sp. TC10]
MKNSERLSEFYSERLCEFLTEFEALVESSGWDETIGTINSGEMLIFSDIYRDRAIDSGIDDYLMLIYYFVSKNRKLPKLLQIDLSTTFAQTARAETKADKKRALSEGFNITLAGGGKRPTISDEKVWEYVKTIMNSEGVCESAAIKEASKELNLAKSTTHEKYFRFEDATNDILNFAKHGDLSKYKE